jgi:putative ATP-binding cassette transporter
MSTKSTQQEVEQRTSRYLLATFWETALGFWRSGWTAWLLTATIIAITLVNLFVQYRINVWNRHLFDALEKKDGSEVWTQALIFLPLTVANVSLAVAAIYTRMSTQQTWRRWLNARVLDRWITGGRYYQLTFISGDHANPEYRVADDLRVAVDAPVDFAVGLLNAVLSAVTFIGVLWFIGGALTIPGTSFTIPGFLVVTAVIYAVVASGAMVTIGRSFVRVSENKNQAEAEYRYGLTRLRENGESIALLGGETEERAGLDTAFQNVLRRWRQYTLQFLRTTVVSQTSQTFVPVMPLILCAPKYLAGEMSLGQVMQAASAFVTVQIAFNWLVDNYPRLADWTASARRVASLLVSLERLDRCDLEEGPRHIILGENEGTALQLRNVSVTLDDGSVVVNEAVVEIDRGERVLVEGESGTGKSTLVRAISGLWPWGSGEILIQTGARIFLMPQRPYVPLGTLRRATTYPSSPDEIDDGVVRKALEKVGLGHFVARLDEDSHWENTLSGGEKQRLAFARLLILRPDIVIMDEATSALDPASQEHLMNRMIEQLPEATVISVGHRPELEKFHDRKILLAYHADGARLVRDENLAWPRSPSARLLSRLLAREKNAASAG